MIQSRQKCCYDRSKQELLAEANLVSQQGPCRCSELNTKQTLSAASKGRCNAGAFHQMKEGL